MKKKIVLIIIIVLLITCGCGKKNNLENTLLAGHSWGETPNESKTIGMTDTLFEYKIYSTSKAKHNKNNELNEIYYCIIEDLNGQNIKKTDYDYLVNKFTDLIGKEPEVEIKDELTFKRWYDGTLQYILEFRDESQANNSTSDNIIYISIINDKY